VNGRKLRSTASVARKRTRSDLVLFTFASELRITTPELHDWLMTAATHEAIVPGAIGDGAVQVRLC